MNLLFVTCARYPTEKAYGVTVGNTMKSLTKVGISNKIITWDNQLNDEYRNTIESITKRPLRLPLRLYNANPRFISKLSYMVNQMIFSFYFAKMSRKYPVDSIFWTREPLTLIVHSIFNRKSRYLIDLHHSVGFINRFAIRFLGWTNRIQIIVLSADLEKIYSKIFSKKEIINLPMGVPESFRRLIRTKDNKEFVIGYVGKGFSNGHDNELSEIIHTAKILEHVPEVRFIFVGLEEGYIEQLSLLINKLEVSPQKISFVHHLKHSEMPDELLKFDVGIIPYPESLYNSERFPLKILEYAAVGLPIIASDTKSHRNLLNDSFANFYQKGNYLELSTLILNIMHNPSKYSLMSKNARAFSSNFTYDERVRKLLSSIDFANK